MTKIINDERGFGHLWLVVIAVVVVIGGAGLYVAEHSAQSKLNSSTNTQTTTPLKPLSTNLNGLLPEDKVKQLATQDKPGATVSQIGLVQTGNGPVFHVQLEDGSALDLDAKTGAKVESAEVDNNSEGSQLPAGFAAAINFVQAEQIAKTQVSQGTVMRIQLEVENGTPVYSVRFSTGAKVQINANNGTVIKVDAAKAQGKQPTGSKDSSEQQSGNTTKGDSGSESGSTKTSGGSSDQSGGSGDNSSSGSDSSGSGGSSGGSGSTSGDSGSGH